MPTSSPLYLAIFDLDGTIVDSLGVIVAGMRAAGQGHSLEEPDPHAVKRVVGLPLRTAIERLFPGQDDMMHEALTESYRESIVAMRGLGLAEEPLFPEVESVLSHLVDRGWLLGLATGKSYRGVVNTLKPHRLLNYFLTVQTADRAPGKPDPEMLFQAMSETGTEKSCTVMVGDTSYDMAMARNAGIFAIGVDWGYHNVEELKKAGAHAIVENWSSLPSIIEALVEKEK